MDKDHFSKNKLCIDSFSFALGNGCSSSENHTCRVLSTLTIIPSTSVIIPNNQEMSSPTFLVQAVC